MDALPDELLLHALSYVTDAVTLLDSVPLVCKRWHRVSRDPGAWASASVVLRDGRGRRALRRAARVLLHAPALHRVSLAFHDALRPGKAARRYLFPALRRGHGVVRELHLDPGDRSVERFKARERTALLGLLWRSQRHLRVLSLGSLLRSEKNYPVTETGALQIMDVLAHLVRLEQLQISLRSTERYRGELASVRRLPRLRRLEIWPKDCWCRRQPLALGMDLVRGCAATLQDLHFVEGNAPLPNLLLEAIALCRQLRSLRVGLTDIQVVRHLPRLQALHLEQKGAQREEMDAAARFEARILSMMQCAALRDLRHLTIDISFETASMWFQTHWMLIGELLVALSLAAPKVTHLRLHGGCAGKFREYLATMLDAMPDLEDVRLGRCLVDVVPRLVPLSNLRRVSGKVRCNNSEEVSVCREVLEDFHKQRPDVLCPRLECHYVYAD